MCNHLKSDPIVLMNEQTDSNEIKHHLDGGQEKKQEMQTGKEWKELTAVNH